jgi:hypothetical protein
MRNPSSNTDVFMIDQEEIVFSNNILFEVNNYKLVLQKYLQQELLKNHPEMYVGYFNCHPLLNQLNLRSPDPLMNIYNDLSKNNNDDIRKIFLERLNLLRALANYQKMDNAVNILNFSPHNVTVSADLATAAGRVRALFQRYPDFQNHLKTIGNFSVDHTTNKIKTFFKKVWSNIIWYFSEAHQQEKIFTKKTRQYCREYNLFKTKKTTSHATSLSVLQIRPTP